jgi:NAD(P)-dependent dehydrogenase (short-subunit alcohol dehydrogenase family)
MGTMRRKIVITRGSGGISTAIVDRFLSGGDSVVNLDREPFAGAETWMTGQVLTVDGGFMATGLAYRQRKLL